MVNQEVMVTVTDTTTETGERQVTLTLDAPEVNLNAGDTLSWRFQNVPSDCAPGILFDSEPDDGFGPFQAFALNGDLVTGRGNNGQAGTYSYQPQLLTVNGVLPADAQSGLVQNQMSEPDTSPAIVIACTFTQGSPGQVSIADIDPLRLFVGDTAVWFATGLPSDFFVDFLFRNPVDDALIDPPFESLLFTRQVGDEGSVALKVIGVKFNPGALNSMTYNVQVRNFNGDVIPPPDDPQIDNLGPPPQ